MTLKSGRLFSGLPLSTAAEVFEPLVEAAGVRLERIISTGHHTPAEEWLVQGWDEWVVLLSGTAKLLIGGEAVPRDLQPGDWINIPAGVRHRVEWTCKDPPTAWLALHYNLPDSERRVA
jgi:cupin 2 domain-containing protein